MSNRRRRSLRKRIGLTGCLTLVGITVLVLAIGVYLLLLPTDDGTEAQRAKGYPTTIAELDALYPEPPVGENAAEYYVQAGSILNQSTYPDLAEIPLFGGGNLPPLGTPISDEMLAKISAFLDYEALAFQLIDEANQFEGSRDLAFNQPYTTTLIEMHKVLIGQWLRSRYYNSRGDTDATLAELSKLVHLARSQVQAPTDGAFIPFKMSVERTVSAIEFILNENDLTRDQLTEVDGLLGKLLVEDALVNDIVAMRCRTLNQFDAPQSYSIFNGLARTSFIEVTDAYIAIAEGGLPGQLDEYRALYDREFSWFEILGGIFAGNIYRTTQNFYETQARVNMARMAIAIQHLRLEGGDIPNDWDDMPDELASTWPLDPFSGQPLRYKRIDEGFVIYSVGVNFADDGGYGPPARDLVLRVLR